MKTKTTSLADFTTVREPIEAALRRLGANELAHSKCQDALDALRRIEGEMGSMQSQIIHWEMLYGKQL